jgi:hypothetical protein
MSRAIRKPLSSPRAFAVRLVQSVLFGTAVIAVSLLVGMLGYRGFEGLSWIDAFLNAAMILSGMGPVSPLTHDAGKIFAGLYALYSGLALLIVAGIVFAPVVHRFLHRFHLELD